MKNNKAFTLIELLIVISVISLLSTVVMYSTSEAKLKADDAHMIVESDQVAKAIRLYKDDNGGKAPMGAKYNVSYTGQMVNENDPDVDKKIAYQESMQILVEEGYLSAIPESPDGGSYSYLATADGEVVFAADLKTRGNSSSSNSNSCDVVNEIQFTPSCSTAYANGGNVYDCSEAEYNDETHICYETTDWVFDYCSSYGPSASCVGYSTNDLIPDIHCNSAFEFSGGEEGGEGSCDYYFGPPTGTPPALVCKKDLDNVCSGELNSDYCSCI